MASVSADSDPQTGKGLSSGQDLSQQCQQPPSQARLGNWVAKPYTLDRGVTTWPQCALVHLPRWVWPGRLSLTALPPPYLAVAEFALKPELVCG